MAAKMFSLDLLTPTSLFGVYGFYILKNLACRFHQAERLGKKYHRRFRPVPRRSRHLGMTVNDEEWNKEPD